MVQLVSSSLYIYTTWTCIYCRWVCNLFRFSNFSHLIIIKWVWDTFSWCQLILSFAVSCCRRKTTHLPLRKNVLLASCCTILVSTFPSWFSHTPSLNSWGCEAAFHFHPGIFRSFCMTTHNGHVFLSINCNLKRYLVTCTFRKVISSQILFYFILEDFVFYWGHRILHTKWLYKHVHSVHHE